MQQILLADEWIVGSLHNYYTIGIELVFDLTNRQAFGNNKASLYIPFNKQFIVTLVDHNVREQFPLRWHVRDVNDIDYFNRILSTQTVLLTGIPWVYSELFYNDQGFY